MIIGLTGSNCAGKDTVAEYLEGKKGFVHRSLSDALRDEMRKRKIEITRDSLIRVGTALRRKEGSAVLAKRVVKKMDKSGDYVITSIRHPAEIRELRKIKGFVLVNVDAPVSVRFKRMRKRKRPGDPETLKDFIAAEKRESATRGPGQQLARCREMADFTLLNRESGFGAMHKKIGRLLEKFGKIM